MTESAQVKRFYKEVTVEERAGRFAVLLDGRPVKTQGRNVLLTPTLNLAEVIADEWAGQVEHIIRSSMPMTGMQSAAIDGADISDEWLEEIVKYLGSDLVCYRAKAHEALAERQAAVWDPYINFMREEFGALLVTTSGIVAISQPETSHGAVRRALKSETPETLFGLQIATAISGSAVLALAMWRHAYSAEEAFEASRVDERFQEENWGTDEEAKTREAQLRADFLTVAQFLLLLEG
ncbi:ATP12 family chaperone protein [Hyphococcus sp.]|uniref:ATP12 family chaperone protein n=1 Tax=Hyphococcus sp. TaxID=2038636 RepID=UPI00208B2CAD|nr:MAG: ATPase [Marinicaulis sp.]